MSERQKKAKSILDRIESWFSDKREVSRIRVKSGSSVFWCKNPKKIKWWRELAEKQNTFLLFSKDKLDNAVQILKVEYKVEE